MLPSQLVGSSGSRNALAKKLHHAERPEYQKLSLICADIGGLEFLAKTCARQTKKTATKSGDDDHDVVVEVPRVYLDVMSSVERAVGGSCTIHAGASLAGQFAGHADGIHSWHVGSDRSLST